MLIEHKSNHDVMIIVWEGHFQPYHFEHFGTVDKWVTEILSYNCRHIEIALVTPETVILKHKQQSLDKRVSQSCHTLTTTTV